MENITIIIFATVFLWVLTVAGWYIMDSIMEEREKQCLAKTPKAATSRNLRK